MPIIVIFIFISLGFYVFYKIQYVRTQKPFLKRWLSAKSTISLGLFVGLFGVNRLFLELSTLSLIISIVFIVVGAVACVTGLRAYKYYLPFVEKEVEEWQPLKR